MHDEKKVKSDAEENTKKVKCFRSPTGRAAKLKKNFKKRMYARQTLASSVIIWLLVVVVCFLVELKRKVIGSEHRDAA